MALAEPLSRKLSVVKLADAVADVLMLSAQTAKCDSAAGHRNY